MTTKATRPQQKKFFALCTELDIDRERAMKRAVKLYNLSEFSDISPRQISPLIKAMEEKIRGNEKIKISNSIHARIYDREEQRMLYSQVAKVGHYEGVLMYFPLQYNVNRPQVDDEDIDIMLGSGKYDTQGKEIYRYDIFIYTDTKKDKWLVDIDEETLQWIGVHMKTNEKVSLYKFKKIKVVGSVYGEVEE